MFSKKINYRIINLSALFFLLYIIASNIELWIGILGKVFSVCAPFIIAFVFAYAFSPLVKKMEKNNIKRKYAVGIVVTILIIILITILAITLPMVYEESISLGKKIIEAINNVIIKYNVDLTSFELKISEMLNNITNNIGSLASSTFSKSIDFAGKFLVGFIVFVYFLADMDKIRHWFKLFLKSQSGRIYKYFKLLDVEVSKYISGMAIFMFIQCIEYSILFFLIGHPDWLILGLLAGLTNVVPYFGGIFTNIVAIITASVVSTPLTIMTILIFIVFSQIDCYYISPKVYGKTNNVNALITIMVVTIGGSLAGVLGIVVALPIYLLIRETFKFFKNDIKKGMNIMKETIEE